MRDLEYCAKQTVDVCSGLKPEERVVVIHDEAAIEIADSVVYRARKISHGNVFPYMMERFGLRPDDGSTPLQFPRSIGHALGKADLSFYIAGQTKKNERESFRVPMLKIVNNNQRLRHVHMPGITMEAFLAGMSSDYDIIRRVTRRVNSRVKDAEVIRVTTPLGTDFTAIVRKYRWEIADGFASPEKWINLPDGETFTSPESAYGRIVVDGSLGDHFDQKYGLLHETPLNLIVDQGRVISVRCDGNDELQREFSEYIRIDENANRIGEFAIGTNIGIDGLIGNMIHDEKFPGVHVAVGDPLSEFTGAEWESKVHCDMTMRLCNIYVDGEQIMENGKFSEVYLPRK